SSSASSVRLRISFADASAPLPEESAQQFARFTFTESGIELGLMMAGRLVEDARTVLDAAALGIGGPPVEPADAGEGNRLGAHRAGLQRNIEIAIDQARRAELRRRRADRQHLGMGGGIAHLLGAVA